MQGWRVSMEDAHTVLPTLPGGDHSDTSYFGVFDGHGGRKVANFASLNLHKYITKSREYTSGKIKSALEFAFLDIDKDMSTDRDIIEEMSGSTAVIVLIKENILYCANVGDSRAVACVDGMAAPLSEDHKPTAPGETSRIIAAGGFVEADRVNGSLALSRALGDFQFKNDPSKPPSQQMVSPCPDIVTKELNPKWNFFVIACDGIWEVLSNEDVIHFVQEKLSNGLEPDIVCEQLMDKCVAPTTDNCGPGCDNMTVIIVVFNWKSGDHN